MVVKELTKFFLTNEIAEGDKLPTELELYERLRVGRSTVRESIKALQVMGYVSIEPGRGAFLKRKILETPVHRILSCLGSRKVELAEFIEVRMQLEPLAVRLAVERGTVGEASHNTLLIELNNLVIEAFKEFRDRTFKVENHAKNAVTPHRKITAAIQKRDAVAAQLYMKDHLFKALEDMSLGAGE